MTTNEEWIAQETTLVYEPILSLMETLYGGALDPKVGPLVRERIELGLRRALLRGARGIEGFGENSFVPSATNPFKCRGCGCMRSEHSPMLDCCLPPWKMVP